MAVSISNMVDILAVGIGNHFHKMRTDAAYRANIEAQRPFYEERARLAAEHTRKLDAMVAAGLTAGGDPYDYKRFNVGRQQ